MKLPVNLLIIIFRDNNFKVWDPWKGRLKSRFAFLHDDQGALNISASDRAAEWANRVMGNMTFNREAIKP